MPAAVTGRPGTGQPGDDQPTMEGDPMTVQASEALGAETIEGLATSVRGAVVRPGDADYDDARAIWNGLIDRRPGLIVQCSGAADVVDAVNFAHDNGLVLSVKEAAGTTSPEMPSTTAGS